MAEACYKEPYLQGSFKFVTFKTEEASSEHGRRGAEGEFAFGEVTAYADLGIKIRTYGIRARFDSNLHVIEAAALIAACESSGPGVLVHPTRGVIASAACRSLKVTDKIETDGGVTYVDMLFVAANNWPNGLSLIGQAIGFLLSPFLSAARDNFTSNYAPATVQPFRRDAVIAAVQEQVSNISTEYQVATLDTATEASRNSIVNDLLRVVSEPDLAGDTEAADRALSLGMTVLAQNLTGAAKFDAFRRIANGAAKTSSFASPAAEVENSIYTSVRLQAAAYMTQAALEVASTRTADVFEQLDAVSAILADEAMYLRGLCEDSLFIEVNKFRDDAVARLYAKAYDSPALAAYDFNGRVHPLVAAYSIYGDAKKHRDLETLNAIGVTGRIGPSVAAPRNP